jgi:hypothetical protein
MGTSAQLSNALKYYPHQTINVPPREDLPARISQRDRAEVAQKSGERATRQSRGREAPSQRRRRVQSPGSAREREARWCFSRTCNIKWSRNAFRGCFSELGESRFAQRGYKAQSKDELFTSSIPVFVLPHRSQPSQCSSSETRVALRARPKTPASSTKLIRLLAPSPPKSGFPSTKTSTSTTK